LFACDKSSLKEGSKPILDGVAEQIKQHTDIELVMVTGHTDRIGSEAYNQKLSEARANTVREYLVSQGVDGSRLQAVGKGESEPVVDCAGVHGNKAIIECLAPNRRVIVDATHKQEVGCK
jgi:OOP family OmpA-OmpF porin